MSWEPLGTNFLKAGLWGIQQKKDSKKLLKNNTCILNYPENFNFLAFVWHQDAKLFQFSSTCTNSCP